MKTILLGFATLLLTACGAAVKDVPDASKLRVGAEQPEIYQPLLQGQSIAVVANATSMNGDTHLVDSLLAMGGDVRKVFAPEHGFRGEKDAGEMIDDEVDAKTGLPIISLYGAMKKPTPEQLQDIDIIVFDIQDVGVRFYTYLSTLHYVMESCAENNVPLIVLDRPNPNGFYVDGPMLEPAFSSFVGLHPVPLVYGMTIGEYARMINGQGWLSGGAQCDLTVVTIDGYSRDMPYDLPVKPSPNLTNAQAVYLYPSLALFEGTVVSIGRGTDFPFQVIGHPDYTGESFTFTPRPVVGAMTPKLQGALCRGVDLRKTNVGGAHPHLSLAWLIEFYDALPDKEGFFLPNNFFNKLAGNDRLMAQIKAGMSADDIRQGWQADIVAFRAMREPYLLYE